MLRNIQPPRFRAGRPAILGGMSEHAQHKPAKQLLVVMPTWLGDCVMAGPTLRALQQLYPQAHITALVRANVRPLIEAMPWVDRILSIRPSRSGRSDIRRKGPVRLARRLARSEFDTAVVLPNSFRSALVVTMAGVPRRIGYNRDGRGFLLTDRLMPRKNTTGYMPVPALDYYLGIARYLGADNPDPEMALFTRATDDKAADELLGNAGFDPDGDSRLILLNPGAQKPGKRWSDKYFAALADRCSKSLGATVALTGAPTEREILNEVIAAANEPIIDLPAHGLNLTLLKSVVRRCSVVVTNDTGPRHIAAAMGTPVVTLFGPTEPGWTEIGFADERQIVADGVCSVCSKPGQKNISRCMHRIDAEAVFAAVSELFARKASPLERS
jgi:heptosyltransferase-2